MKIFAKQTFIYSLLAGLLAWPGLAVHAQDSEDALEEERAGSAPSGSREEEMVEEVIVTGVRASLEQSIDRKREANQVVDVITAEDIGKLPDQNVAESLQRVPGVQITRGSNISVGDNDGVGEGSEVSIRGTPPNLNKATINGQTIATASVQGGIRAFNFNVISPELVKRLEVFKTPTADMDEGSLGGTVNLKTHDPLDIRNRIASISIRQRFNRLVDDEGHNYSLFYIDKFFDDKFGISISYNRTDEPFRRDSFESFGWDYVGVDPNAPISDNPTNGNIISVLPNAPNLDPNREYGFIPRDIRQNLRLEDRERDGLNITLQWQPTNNLDFKLNYLSTDLQRNETASNNVFRFTQVPNQIQLSDYELDGDIFVTASSLGTRPFRRWHFVTLFERVFSYETEVVSLEANWNLGAWGLSFTIGQSEGDGVQDPSLFVQFATRTQVSYDLRNSRFPEVSTANGLDFSEPSRYVVTALSRALRSNDDEEEYFQLDFDRSFDGWLSSVEFGIKFRDRTKEQLFAIDAVPAGQRLSTTLADYSPGPNGTFPVDNFRITDGLPSRWAFPSADLILSDYGDLLANPSVGRTAENGNQQRYNSNWDVTEKIMGTYVKVNFETERLRGNAGVRVSETEQEGNSLTNLGDAIKDTRSYTEVLPSLNLVYTLRDDLLLRVGVARVMARPSFEQLTLGYNINEAAMTATRGNPDLDPFLSDQYDFSVEWYFQKGALLSGAVFFKDIDSFVFDQQRMEEVPGQVDENMMPEEFLVTSPENGDGADVMGFEFAYQQNYTFLPSPFDGFGTIFNYTYADSNTSIDDVFGKELPLQGLSENSMNLILFYEKYGLSARLAYNQRDEYLIFTRGLAGLPIYQDEYKQLDASLSYQLADSGFTFILEWVNINDEESISYAGDRSRLVSWREFGSRYSFGIRYKF